MILLPNALIIMLATAPAFAATAQAASDVNSPTANSQSVNTNFSSTNTTPNTPKSFGFDTGRSDQFDPGAIFLKMIAAVILVVALGLVLVFVSKRLAPRISNSGSKRVRIIETTPLPGRKMLLLVKAGGRELLIGSTQEKLTMLADVTENFFDTDTEVQKKDIDEA